MLCHYWYFKDVGFKFKPHKGDIGEGKGVL